MRLLRRLGFFLLIMFLGASPALAGQFEEAMKAYNSGDFAAAFPLFEQLARQGRAEAQYHLWEMYLRGQGVTQNAKEAVKWLQKAADQSYDEAQYHLAMSYLIGEGVPRNDQEAVKWLQAAAMQDHGEAQFLLGTAYDNGQIVAQDNVKAHFWFNLAAQSLTGAMKELAIEARTFVTNRMTPAQLAEAQRLAREWKPKKER